MPYPNLAGTHAYDALVTPWEMRATRDEGRRYQAMDVWTVEMEAAALFAVTTHRGIEIASAFVISDSLAELVWTPGFRDPFVDRGLDTLYSAAVATLLEAGLD